MWYLDILFGMLCYHKQIYEIFDTGWCQWSVLLLWLFLYPNVTRIMSVIQELLAIIQALWHANRLLNLSLAQYSHTVQNHGLKHPSFIPKFIPLAHIFLVQYNLTVQVYGLKTAIISCHCCLFATDKPGSLPMWRPRKRWWWRRGEQQQHGCISSRHG